MTKGKAETKQPAPPTKKHLARAEREHKQMQLILTIALATGALIVGLVGYALIQGYVVGPNLKVAVVDDVTIKVKDFQADAAMRRVEDLLQYDQYSQYVSLYQQLGLTVDAQLQALISNLEYELTNKTYLASAVISKMIEDILIEKRLPKQELL